MQLLCREGFTRIEMKFLTVLLFSRLSRSQMTISPVSAPIQAPRRRNAIVPNGETAMLLRQFAAAYRSRLPQGDGQGDTRASGCADGKSDSDDDNGSVGTESEDDPAQVPETDDGPGDDST